jgi:hypothetical protein
MEKQLPRKYYDFRWCQAIPYIMQDPKLWGLKEVGQSILNYNPNKLILLRKKAYKDTILLVNMYKLI